MATGVADASDRERVDVAFRAFYDSTYDQNVRRAALVLGADDVANDIVQDVMMRVYRRWDDIDNHGAYVARAVMNGCRDELRSRSRHRRATWRMWSRPDVDAPQEPLADLLDQLPFNQRAVVVLRFYGGLTVAEIADTLGCPKGSIGPWLDRALSTLKGRLL
jgi:RNA polymerase sigma factor (sigma-70 family)